MPGTGKDGRVLKGDILAFIKGDVQPIAAAEPAATAATAAPSTPALTAPVVEDVVVPLTGIQRAMAKSMNAAWSVPHFGYCDEVSMDGLIALRQQVRSPCHGACALYGVHAWLTRRSHLLVCFS